MLPPLLRILLDEPALLTAHAAAYSELIKEESGMLQARIARRIGYLFVVYGCALLALLFAGVALGDVNPTELKHELDRWGVFKEYEDRFLDMFRRRR